jgi:hypothetical protein
MVNRSTQSCDDGMRCDAGRLTCAANICCSDVTLTNRWPCGVYPPVMRNRSHFDMSSGVELRMPAGAMGANSSLIVGGA